MGFLKVQGQVLTYNDYKDPEAIARYKMHGIKQFVALYTANKDKFIPLDDLKWGEEMEYQIYQCASVGSGEDERKRMLLSNQGPQQIKEFNESNSNLEHDILLMPEFGGWMVEAVPAAPYGSIVDASELLSCEEKLHQRRAVLDKYFKERGLQLVSMTNVPSLGTPGHVALDEHKHILAE